eukprot:INCI11287.1.p1 GENE.INCI11287.1~~INCI11287.1.p1  ORF type:complete len:850 (-),score=111.51 INCI11287.1:404-2953(-)
MDMEKAMQRQLAIANSSTPSGHSESVDNDHLWEMNSDSSNDEVAGSTSTQPARSERSGLSSVHAPRRTTEEFVQDLPVHTDDNHHNHHRCSGNSTSTLHSEGPQVPLNENEDTRKISDILLHAKATGKATVSFEFFPATTPAGNQSLLQQIERVGYELRPSFVSLTWSAAFNDEEEWINLGEVIQKRWGISVLMHLTCHKPADELGKLLDRLRSRGLRNVLALRGDIPANARCCNSESSHGTAAWNSHKKKGCFTYAVELVEFIRRRHGNYFCIAVGGYPETHPGCWNNTFLPPSEQARALDLKHLKQKVDAGADFIISQFVYDPERFLSWRLACRDIGITEPIVAGYLPLYRMSTFENFTSWCHTAIPIKMQRELELIHGDDNAVRTYGVKMAVAHLRTLLLGTTGLGLVGLDNGAASYATHRGSSPCYNIHLYTANQVGPHLTKILRKLDLLPLYISQRQRYGAGYQWDSCYNQSSNGNEGDSQCDLKNGHRHTPSDDSEAKRGDINNDERDQNTARKSPPISRGSSGSWNSGSGHADSNQRGGEDESSRIMSRVSSGNTINYSGAGSPMGQQLTNPDHEVRPIFWENRQSSYLQRTKSWEQFPNGRWGTLAQEASFGSLAEYHFSSQKERADLRAMWGSPKTEEQVAQVFVDFLKGKTRSIPWITADDVAPETNRMRHDLLRINTHGFLSINSQPAVNGAPSTDPDVGWGPPDSHGYVFQKAYIEFFTSPFLFQKLLKALPQYSTLSYHAVNARGEEYHNYDDNNSVNAVTWGVFPEKEIVQPTIVDASSFRVWKDEAFDLWIKQWASIYEPEGETKDSYNVIKRIHDTYLLVNIVDNVRIGCSFR